MYRPVRVLLIDDNPQDAILLQELLSETSIPTEITTLSDGEKAISEMARTIEQGSSVDLVFRS